MVESTRHHHHHHHHHHRYWQCKKEFPVSKLVAVALRANRTLEPSRRSNTRLSPKSIPSLQNQPRVILFQCTCHACNGWSPKEAASCEPTERHRRQGTKPTQQAERERESLSWSHLARHGSGRGTSHHLILSHPGHRPNRRHRPKPLFLFS
jgi:hypothetical protein